MADERVKLVVGSITFAPVGTGNAGAAITPVTVVAPAKRSTVDKVADMIAALGDTVGDLNTFLADLAADNLERAEEAEESRDTWHQWSDFWRDFATRRTVERDDALNSASEWRDSAFEKINRLVLADRRLTWAREGKASADAAAKTARTALEFAVRDLAVATGHRHDPHDIRRMVTNYLADAAQAIAGPSYRVGDPGDETVDGKRSRLLSAHRLNGES